VPPEKRECKETAEGNFNDEDAAGSHESKQYSGMSGASCSLAQSAGRVYAKIKAVVQVYRSLFCLSCWKRKERLLEMIRKVAVIMGSDSDWPVVKGACAQLKALGIPFEAHILSAHRTPAEAAEFAKSARANGFGVILCAAGMAAHLAGAFAANTTLPVIGIPMKGGAMDGLDALLATVQMPSGIPVATVALNGAKNAAWLAAEILALGDDALAEKLAAERTAMAAQIAAKEEKLQAEIAEL